MLNPKDYGNQIPFAIQRMLASMFPNFRRYLADLMAHAKEADHDLLTQLKNERGARDLFRREVRLLLREHRLVPVTAVFVDLDGFKAVNDSLGHAIGDECLVHFASLMTRPFRVRGGDIVWRKGGDEFVALLINAERSQVEERVGRLFDMIQSDPKLTYVTTTGEALRVTASIGVASSCILSPTLVDEAWNVLLERADEAMYRSKRAGKNQIETTEVTNFGQP